MLYPWQLCFVSYAIGSMVQGSPPLPDMEDLSLRNAVFHGTGEMVAPSGAGFDMWFEDGLFT